MRSPEWWISATVNAVTTKLFSRYSMDNYMISAIVFIFIVPPWSWGTYLMVVKYLRAKGAPEIFADMGIFSQMLMASLSTTLSAIALIYLWIKHDRLQEYKVRSAGETYIGFALRWGCVSTYAALVCLGSPWWTVLDWLWMSIAFAFLYGNPPSTCVEREPMRSRGFIGHNQSSLD